MNDLARAKAAMRAEMRRKRAEIPLEQRLRAAETLANTGRNLLFGGDAPVVSGYVPIRGELDPGALMTRLAEAGARLALPRVDGDCLSFRLHHPGAALVTGAYGIAEPAVDAPQVAPELMLVPLLAFDRLGGRLGYGAGYYDRAIVAHRPRLTVGLAFACQEVATVPMEPHDRRLDLVLTEVGLIDCRRAPSA